MDMLASAYMSGALSGLKPEEEKKQIARYELIQRVGAEEGYDVYCPHQHSGPKTHPNMTSTQVYERDSTEVSKVDLVIADCTLPSFGVGIESEMAEQRQIPVLLIAEQGTYISRLIRGLPNVVKVGGDADVLYFPTEEALTQRLRNEIRVLRPRLLEARQRREEARQSANALAEYARTRNITFRRYEHLQEAVAAVGGKPPLTVEEWEEFDKNYD